jgi:hypothetical protein
MAVRYVSQQFTRGGNREPRGGRSGTGRGVIVGLGGVLAFEGVVVLRS